MTPDEINTIESVIRLLDDLGTPWQERIGMAVADLEDLIKDYRLLK